MDVKFQSIVEAWIVLNWFGETRVPEPGYVRMFYDGRDDALAEFSWAGEQGDFSAAITVFELDNGVAFEPRAEFCVPYVGAVAPREGCPICLMESGNEGEVADLVAARGGNEHVYHGECLEEWIMSQWKIRIRVRWIGG